MDREHFSPNQFDLEVLARYLESGRAPAGCMNLPCVDGFLTGVVVGPGFIPRSEWLETIWAGEDPDFDSELARQLITGTIIALHDRSAMQAGSPLYNLRPICYLRPNGETIVTDWVGGFLAAVSLRRPAWQPLIDDCETRNLIVPLLFLNGDLALPSELHFFEGEDDLHASAQDVIPHCVKGIRDFSRHHRGRIG